MNRTTIIPTAAIIAFVSLYMLQCGKTETKNIRIFGSTTIEPLIQKAAEQLNATTHIAFTIKSIGSNAGIDSLIAGSCDIAMSSSEVSAQQIRMAVQQGISLEPFLLGYDVIVPIVHPSNKLSYITFDDLHDIYSGTIRRWSEVGGADTVIDVVDRDHSSGTHEVWHHAVTPSLQAEEFFTVSQSNSSMLGYIAEHENAIGYVSLSFLNSEVRPLKLNGIAITESDSLLSEYHLKRPLYLYVNEERFSNEARTFVMFLIFNEKGRRLMREAGFYSFSTMAPVINAAERIGR